MAEADRAHLPPEVLSPLSPFTGEKPPAPAWFDWAIAQEPERTFVTSGGARIESLAWGERGKPGLLFVHGASANADCDNCQEQQANANHDKIRNPGHVLPPLCPRIGCRRARRCQPRRKTRHATRQCRAPAVSASQDEIEGLKTKFRKQPHAQ